MVVWNLVPRLKKYALVVALALTASGCATTSHDNDYLELKKDVIKLEHQVQSGGEHSANEKSHVDDGYPVWFLTPEKYFEKAYGVSCEIVNGTGVNSQEKAKSVALDKSRLALFRSISANQKLYAEESVKKDSNGFEYSAKIFSKSFGSIGRNEIAEQGLFKDNGQTHYCVAVTLVY